MSPNLNNTIKRSKGFLTKTGSYIDWKEWHTVITAISLAYLSPGAYGIVTIKLFIEERRRHGSFAEYRQELPYWITSGLIAVLAVQFFGFLDPVLGSQKILAAYPCPIGG